MFVDTGLLRAGADESQRAGGHARDGADRLSRGPLIAGMFGAFATADAFHNVLSSTQTGHAQRLQAHYQVLSSVADKACLAAAEFTDMDEGGAAALRTVRCSSATQASRT